MKVAMVLWTSREIEEIYNCRLTPGLEITGISIDSRTLQPGDLFFALQTNQDDGHKYVQDAAAKGAAAVVVSQQIPGCSCPQIITDCTFKALQELGRYGRLRSKAKIIAITGSVGKTTTKEVLRHTLAAFGEVSASVASYNNHWGVPLSLARLPRQAKFGIFEIGMNNPGEITPLSEMVKPHLAIVTAIAPAHIGQMGSLENIAKEKACIFDGLSAEGVAILPADTEFMPYLKTKACQSYPDQIVTVGEAATADIRLIDYHTDEFTATITFAIGGREKQFFHYPLIGRHLAHAALIAIATAKALKLDIKKVLKQLATVPAIQGRGKIYSVNLKGQPIKLVDDSYNANLHSTLAAINTLNSLIPQGDGRKVAILGEMLELGSYAIDHHQQVAKACVDKNIDKVYFCGGMAMKQAFDSLPEAHKGNFVATAHELIEPIINELRANDIVLVKGSKGSKVSLVAEALIAANKHEG
ncbi:UDP-N-acetylmuramoyl-tripeptide--D-alanyl-D-alanine ligase [Candidatus Odyssella thessalonicensis]|uniref:UDP-N-acetylmuramoyl-tripeptide--D-alanyl-D- alanine ligase n=1 Tax=Candidatus Odyssella thessalonicensis TaxID=84647 RepID=UPI000225B44A|nr:UDP-N-acetylmuramoyl-tripeptide--D-alanyl-D-alanine ligase [Candidatus Odyssella thessalonicensis]